MNYYNDIQSLIGKTPLLKLNHLGLKKGVNIFAKLENFNPGGSCKDRIGIYMINEAEKQGILKYGSIIIEATAGNTGIGVALAAINKGYKVIFVVPTKFSIEKQKLMKALGGEIINTPQEKGMQGAVDVAENLLKSTPNSISLRQFDNLANPLAHYETTGKEIYEDLDGEIDCFVGGAGSGGTFSGIVKYLKERIPNVIGILADPEGSTMGGGEEGCYKVEGIGNNFIPNTMNM
ncbi:cystathionine beta-synthase (acetylserine-dependent) [Clostridium gasigenes]|nr:cystathionine beta-synthase (acetylserine-dependent) [Clostridium gasigenes]